MSTASQPTCFLELTDFSLVLARGIQGPGSLRIEAIAEVPLADPAALAEAARKIVPADSTVLGCALRPKPRRWHLTRGEDSSRAPGLGGARHFATNHAEFAKLPPAWFSATQARDGAAPAQGPWLLGVTSATGFTQSLATLDGLRVKPARCVSALHHAIGAVAAQASTPTLLLEVGEQASTAALIGSEGILAVGTVSLNLERIADAVQAELGLKFRGSATKIFFNAEYDFTETGPKIAARLAELLKPELAAIRGTAAQLACTGLPAAQQWFATQLAAALGLSPFAPDLKTFAAKAGVQFGGDELPAAWAGFVRFLASHAAGAADTWHTEWLNLTEPAATPQPERAVVIAAARPQPATLPAKSDVAQPATAKVAAAAKTAAAEKRTEPRPAPLPTPIPKPVESAVSYPPKTVAAPRAANSGANKTVEVFVGKNFDSPPSLIGAAAARAAGASPAAVKRAPVRRNLLPAIAAGVAVLALGGGGFWAYSQNEAAKQLAAEKLKAEQRVQAEAERARLAEQQVLAEAEARKKLQLETQQKLAAAEAARLQAEAEARLQFAARLANARGSLTIATEPAGASITVGDLPARTAPAVFSDLKIGRYPVMVSLPNHEALKLEVEIKENATTDAGVLRLARLVGTAVIASEPAGAQFELRPANALFVSPADRRSGETPATLNDLTPGDYVVTFRREGWEPHEATLSITRDATTKVAWTFPNGSVKITSNPPGAIVSAAGTQLGLTPLTLGELPPGDVAYEIALPGHDPVQLTGRIRGGAVLELGAEFREEDRFYTAEEVEQRAEPIRPQKPELPYYLTLERNRAQLQVTISPAGVVKDIQILHTTDKVFGKIYAEAVAKWRFKPAVLNGRAVTARILMPIAVAPNPGATAKN